MAKKQKENKEMGEKNYQLKEEEKKGIEEKTPLPKIPPEIEKKLAEIKEKLEKFKKKVLEKFEDYVAGIALMPPEKPEKEEKTETEKPEIKQIRTLVLIDDSEPGKISKEELKERVSQAIDNIAKEIDKSLKAETFLLTELWQGCYDGKYELLRMVSSSAPIYDRGMLAAIKIAEIHKTMVLQKFEKYIVSYVLAGSLVQGKATATSDIDVWIVVDDTDVKKMSRFELKDKLRAIIYSMGFEASEITGIKNKLNIQVYILTEFWDSLREANPIIFTLLRDGVPFFDRGLFMPWKLMLKMGKIKPSREAIDMFMSSGSQILERCKFKLKEIGMEDVYYAILTPSQAAIMLYGLAPPTPRETPEMMREIFVKKEKLLEPEYIKILENNIQVRKEIEHSTKKELTGKEVDELLQGAEKYLKRIESLFKQIQKIKEEENLLRIYDEVVTLIRNVLKEEGVEKVADIELIKKFEEELIASGKIPAKFLRDLNEIIEGKKLYDQGKLTRVELEKAIKGSSSLIKFLLEYLQRKRGKELERAKIKVKYGQKFGEIVLLDDIAFIIHNIDEKEKRVSKAMILKDGSLGNLKDSSLKEMEDHLVNKKFPERVFIKEPVFESIKNIFGREAEVLIS